MAKGRHRSTSNVSGTNGHQPHRPPTASPQLKRQLAVASESIYQNNLTVLRRRDPSIVSILDQFSHVCLYHYNGEKWAKQGFEGSMFLVEHQDEPRYGLFILNRMGTGDYGRRIYPEDETSVSGDYLMYRYFPDFTEKRIAMHLPFPLPNEHRAAFDAEFDKDVPVGSETDSAQRASKEVKGKFVIIGFWMFPTDAREPLKDVMIRLHSYIKKGLPYPEEYRYLQGRQPGDHTRKPSQSSSAEDDGQTPQVDPELGLKTSNNYANSEVDKLFAKLQPPSAEIVSSQSSHGPTASNWLDALSGVAPLPSSTSAPATTHPAPRGLALLDSIFASVRPPPAPPQPSGSWPSQPEEIQIVSPKPTSSTLPQILNQDVIYSLLGLASDDSSRASSAAPSSASSRRSRNRYEGDNEYSDSLNSDAEYSTSSTVADFEDPAVIAAGAPTSEIPTLSLNQNGFSDLEHESGVYIDGSQRVPGDVTPRVMARGMDSVSPPMNGPSRSQHFLTPPNGLAPKPSAVPVLKTSSSSTSISTIINKPLQPQPSQSQPRTLIPFQADSDLWPYPRAPIDERDPDDSDLVELDFSDTRALSDPAVFSSHLQKQQKQKQNGKRKSRRERAADREREREAIESSWDDPTSGQAQLVDMISQPGAPSAAQPPTCTQTNGKHAVVNGAGSASTVVPTNGSLDSNAARVALLSALTAHAKAPAMNVPRKQFVQEILGLIYSDSDFVDRLYQEYCSSIN